jgi:RNA polymerase sigma-70 factor (ECF subfamily)
MPRRVVSSNSPDSDVTFLAEASLYIMRVPHYEGTVEPRRAKRHSAAAKGGSALNTPGSLVGRALEEKHAGSPVKTAFTGLVKKYQDMVFGLAYAIVQDHFLAQDVTQEALIIAYDRLDCLVHADAFPYWLQRIARRESFRALRKRRRAAEEGPDLESLPGGNPPEQTLERKEMLKRIRIALSRLPEGQRVPVVLYHIDGYSQGEIADFLELKTNTVKKRIQRGRESMQKDLMGMFEADLKSIRPSKDGRLIKAVNLRLTFDAAAKGGQLDLLEQMLVDGVEVNGIDAGGRTLLHWAVENDHVEAVRLLLKYGADERLPDRSGKTARQLAGKRGNPAVLRLFDAKNAGKARGA